MRVYLYALMCIVIYLIQICARALSSENPIVFSSNILSLQAARVPASAQEIVISYLLVIKISSRDENGSRNREKKKRKNKGRFFHTNFLLSG